MDQQFHRKRTEETNYKILFLQQDQDPSKHQLTKLYTVAGVKILQPFVQTLSKHQFPEMRNFKRHILADSHLTAAAVTDAVQHFTCVEASTYITEGLTRAFNFHKPDHT